MNLKALSIIAIFLISLVSGCSSVNTPTPTIAPTEMPTVNWAITTPTPDNQSVNVTAIPPTATPTPTPTVEPTKAPTLSPTQTPTISPTQQPTVSPSTPTPVSITYIGNKNTKKFHLTSCRYVGTIAEGNRVTLNSRDEAISKGYVPCQVCNP